MKLRGQFFLLGFCSLLLSALAVKAQIGIVDRDARTKPTLVILGTYHMGVPGNNIVNPKVNDVTAPERQKQMAELVERLKKFKPTKIVLEIDSEDEAKTQEAYDKYLSGRYQLTKNETNQIGFRLAKELGHKKVYCVDWSEFWDDPSINYEKYASGDAELDSFLKGVYRNLKKEVDAEFEKLLPLSITDQLIFLNQPDHMQNNHKTYFDLMRIGRGKDYAGANYVSWWYRRNMVILVNVIRITDSPNDRILVIYGEGHNKLLTQFAKESGFYNVESPLKYLQSKK
ncbi:MAG TPA: DUF5694 domain-containing protein [Pyrinomonadaceae bacterium]|jgi:hypothetical protein|nr:DUF5694 domain-containing protein [Pyrinomonadaceae bacterium]